MTDKPVLVVLNPDSKPEELLNQTLKTHPPEDIYTLFTPDKHTSQEIQKHIEYLRAQTDIPADQHLTISVKGIVQKTWRTIKRYTESESAPPKDTPDRKTKLNKLRQQNLKRLQHLETRVKRLVAQDQATRLKARLITYGN